MTEFLTPDQDSIEESVSGQDVFGLPSDNLFPDEDAIAQSVEGHSDSEGYYAPDASGQSANGSEFSYEGASYNDLRSELAKRNESLSEEEQIVPESQKAEDIEKALRADDESE